MSLTPLEQTVGKAIEALLYAEVGFSDVMVEDVAKKAGLSVDSAKGVIGSLVKKGVVFTDVMDNGGGQKKLDFVYLRSQYHKNWAMDDNVNHITLW